MKKFNKNIYLASVVMLTSVCANSCKKFLDVGPPKTEAISSVVFSNNTTATNAMLDIYGDIMNTQDFVSITASVNLGLAADEFTSYSLPISAYYTNTLLANSNDDFWTNGYRYIYKANEVIAGLSAPSSTVSAAYKHQLIGEALFVRAFMHFYLVNLFGDIPYANTTDYTVTNNLARMPASDVYAHIIADHKQSKALLTDGYPNVSNVNPSATSQERIRPNRGAARALLARTYLYTKDWNDAKLEADSLIGNTTNYQLLPDLNQVFLKNSREAIWQLQPSNPSFPNGYEGLSYILTSAPSFVTQMVVALTPQQLSAFEPGDSRRINWVGTFTNTVNSWSYPYKYKVPKSTSTTVTAPTTEYSMVLRLAEVYLIRAEARIQNNDISGGLGDLNILRTRARAIATTAVPAPLPALALTLSKDDALMAVAHERQVELFTEWGHRWLDLKRTGMADAVLGQLKGSNWQTEDQLFPIPQTQLNLDPAISGHQNPNY